MCLQFWISPCVFDLWENDANSLRIFISFSWLRVHVSRLRVAFSFSVCCCTMKPTFKLVSSRVNYQIIACLEKNEITAFQQMDGVVFRTVSVSCLCCIRMMWRVLSQNRAPHQRLSFTRPPYGADHKQRLCVATFGKWVGEATLSWNALQILI